jgi:hypothetical protein
MTSDLASTDTIARSIHSVATTTVDEAAAHNDAHQATQFGNVYNAGATAANQATAAQAAQNAASNAGSSAHADSQVHHGLTSFTQAGNAGFGTGLGWFGVGGGFVAGANTAAGQHAYGTNVTNANDVAAANQAAEQHGAGVASQAAANQAASGAAGQQVTAYHNGQTVVDQSNDSRNVTTVTTLDQTALLSEHKAVSAATSTMASLAQQASAGTDVTGFAQAYFTATQNARQSSHSQVIGFSDLNALQSHHLVVMVHMSANQSQNLLRVFQVNQGVMSVNNFGVAAPACIDP